MNWIKKHRETVVVGMIGFIIFAALNVMMLFYHYDLWIRPKVGFWTTFWNNFEVSGFDPFTYIVISQWRPLYVLSRHPLLAAMVWPLSELNEWLKDITGINCAVHIVAVLWTLLATASWLLMYKILRQIVELRMSHSLLLTTFFFSFSHVLLVTFIEDHMAITLPLLLLAVYLSGKAMKQNRPMPLWQSLPLLFVATGVTTTNCVKIGLADLFSRWGKESFAALVKHFAMYIIPLAVIGTLYYYQMQTTQVEEKRSIENTVNYRMRRDSAFAERWQKEQEFNRKVHEEQLVHLSFVTNTDYKIDRWPSLSENIFGEGLILHERYALTDANKKHRPVLVRYDKTHLYALELLIVAMFIMGIWYGRRERLLWMVMSMFLFDMLLHVGLNFASADVYIMTAHWAFVIPIAVAYRLKHASQSPQQERAVLIAILFATVMLLLHNVPIIYNHIIPA